VIKLSEDPFKFQLLYVIFYMHMTGYIWLRLGTNGWLLQTVKHQDSKKAGKLMTGWAAVSFWMRTLLFTES